MYQQHSTFARLRNAMLVAGVAIVSAALPASAQFKQLPMEPMHEKGQSVTPSFEGWWQNADGTYSLMFGYFNRNTVEQVDLPVGPLNHFDLQADMGQPTHFMPRRHWGVFTAVVPKDFPKDKKLTWTLVANGLTMQVPGNINDAWSINPMSEIGIGNTPPTISFESTGTPNVQGPKPVISKRTAKVGEPLEITVWAADDAKSLRQTPARPAGAAAAGGPGRAGSEARPAGAAAAAPAEPSAAQIAALAAANGVDVATVNNFLGRGAPVNVTWQKFRGPGEVKFANPTPPVEPIPGGTIPVKQTFNGKATTTATFSEPGEYVLRLVANDSSGPGGGGFLCCWTNGELAVSVK